MAARSLLLSALALATSGCVFDYSEEAVDGPYVLASVDGYEPGLCHKVKSSCEGLVEGPIVGIGIGERYLTVARLPTDEGRSTFPAEYFVVDKEAPVGPDRVSGPFTDEEFERERESRRLPDILPR